MPPLDVGKVVYALLNNQEFLRAVTGPKGDSPKIDYTRIEQDVMQRILSDPGAFKGEKGDPGGLPPEVIIALKQARTTLQNNGKFFGWPSASTGLVDAITKVVGK